MISKVYAVFDSKIGEYAAPFQQRSQGEALRGWSDACNDTQTQMNRHPEDYTLFELGEYDSETGKFTNHNTPKSMGVASEFIKPTADAAISINRTVSKKGKK